MKTPLQSTGGPRGYISFALLKTWSPLATLVSNEQKSAVDIMISFAPTLKKAGEGIFIPFWVSPVVQSSSPVQWIVTPEIRCTRQ